AVHDRVRGVHRRRRAAIACGAAAVLVGAIVGLNLPGRDEARPADDGLTGPKTLTSTGYTYDLAATKTGEHDVTLRLPKSDQPRLVSWGAEDDAGRPLSVEAFGENPFTSTADDFGDFYLVLPGESGAITVSGAPGELAVSTYTLSAAVPDGVTKDGSTFRQTLGMWQLVSAEIGDVGDPEISKDVTLPAGPIRIGDLCAGLPKGHWVNLSVDGEGISFGGSSNCQETGFDPDSGEYSTYPQGGLGTPGATVRVRMWISTRMGDTAVVPAGEVPDIRLGFALRGALPEFAGVRYDEPEPVMESAGHTWRAATSGGASGSGPVGVDVGGAGPHLATVSFRNSAPVRYAYFVTVDGERRPLGESAWFDVDGATGSTGEINVPAGAERLTVEPLRGGTPDLQTTVTIYERVD
uniref:hypothetical protein n=1 Tax=Nocardioides jensenii TaxID=1843 RepID=UPI000AD0A11F